MKIGSTNSPLTANTKRLEAALRVIAKKVKRFRAKRRK